MRLANSKKENNIAEYIIFMYQTEDLIRSFGMDIERIKKDLISLTPKDEDEKEELGEWYNTIITTMKQEGIVSSGHLHEVQNLVSALQLLYRTLKKEDDAFQALTTTVQPFFDKNNVNNNEVSICFNGMYGYLILKTGELPVPELTTISAKRYGEVLSYLSYKYKQKNYLNEN